MKVPNPSGASAKLASSELMSVNNTWTDRNELKRFLCAFPQGPRSRGAGGASPNNFRKIFISIENLLFYCCLTAPGRFEVGTGTPLFPVTPEQVHRRIYFDALDLIVSSIEERFDQPSFEAYFIIESLF